MAQTHPRDSQEHCPFSPRAPGRPAARKARARPRAGRRRPATAEEDLLAALRWPKPSPRPGAPWEVPYVAWTDHMERPGPLGQAFSCPAWTAGEEAQDGDSSVSSGRLSGSSGGHKSCAPAHRPWKERPPLVLGSPQQDGESNPRLEQLREKIRAQACWQASCASLGTSMPSSTSHLLRASPPAPRRKVRKLKKAPPAPASPGQEQLPGFGSPSAAGRAAQDKPVPGQEHAPSRVSQRQASVLREKHKSMKSSSCKREKAPRSSTRRAAKDQGKAGGGVRDSELVGVYAWRKGQALVRGLLGPPPALPRLQSKAPSGAPAPTAELGDMEDRAAESSPVGPRTPRPGTIRSDPWVPTHMPNLASCDEAGSIHSAMAILQDLRQQIQAGLDLAQDHHHRGGQERQQLAGRRPKGHWSAPDVRVSLGKSSQSPAKGVHHSSSEWAGSLSAGQRWGASARWESCPQRTWSPQGRNPTFQRPGSPPERPWSASAGQRAGAPCKDWEASPRGRWSLLERPSPTTQRPWSASFVKKAGAPVQCRAHPWPRPTQSISQLAPGQENEARLPPPCPKPRGFLGHPYSPASLREFMRQKALARQQQVLEEKASAVQARELQSQRLQGVYRQQREAVRGRAGPTKAFPLVSQTTPSIVTFVPHSAPSRGQDEPGSVGSPALRWSKVTSGMVLGDQEAPGSFCLCLDRALNHELLETGGPQEGWAGAPLPTSAGSPAGPRKLQDLTAHPPHPGLCIYLGPEEAERLGTRGPLHFRYKHARLQALETMANVLKQRIDLLTANLLGADAADTLEDLPLNPPSSRPSTHSASLAPSLGTPKPMVPACPQAMVPDAGRGSPWGWADMRARLLLPPSCLPDGETLLWSPGWEQRRSVSPGGHLAYSPPGSMEDGRLKLDRRLARDTASAQALGPLAGSSLEVPAPPDPTCGSLWLEEMPSARGAGLVTPWALQSCGPGPEEPAEPGQQPGSEREAEPDAELDEEAQALSCAPCACRPFLFEVSGVQPLPPKAEQKRPWSGNCRTQSSSLRGEAGREEGEADRLAQDIQGTGTWGRIPAKTGVLWGPLLFSEVAPPVLSPKSRGRGRGAAGWGQRPEAGPSLQLDQQKQEQALALLRQRAELEVWETQKALDELLSKHRLARRMEKRKTQTRPGAAPELEGLRLWAGSDPKTSWSAVTARSRCVQGRDGGARPMWKVPGQSPREEELLRLPEEAVQGKLRWEPAWLECQRCPGSQGSEAALVLAEKQPQGLSSLEQGQVRPPDLGVGRW
ncbi:PREDICTED: uncharacterized protein CCDC187 [Myotis davidii]|uniref:uncharacterized protein CCDC187 n=1 Tax=Myotis davidii TaxID=225400 RepID=UPI0003EBBEA1|nr:PREDICTED: uncharacterized protein CCDC187 [Myotis davidii]